MHVSNMQLISMVHLHVWVAPLEARQTKAGQLLESNQSRPTVVWPPGLPSASVGQDELHAICTCQHQYLHIHMPMQQCTILTVPVIQMLMTQQMYGSEYAAQLATQSHQWLG